MSSSLNIILFGQTGSGKSSVINLIAGREIAKVSNGAAGCTLSFKPYTFPVNGRNFHIWDTVGLDEPDMELVAIELARELIQHLASRGGVDLLLFCIRAPRITGTSQANYRLFYEVLCRSSVPVAFVVTHLEQEKEVHMDSWWDRNLEKLEKFGLKAAGHACVTGLPEHHRYQESQRNITRLLDGHNGDGRFNMPAEKWFIEFLRLYGLFAPLKKEARRKDIMKVLLRRCRMDSKLAEELAVKLEGGP
ncbi:P-loop containing nucleoside triphosphate hydrolase protein [Imleria badia]|nr:P-loop containing nucleoside triphosphate hydrolase protein [Imleria badia]